MNLFERQGDIGILDKITMIEQAKKNHALKLPRIFLSKIDATKRTVEGSTIDSVYISKKSCNSFSNNQDNKIKDYNVPSQVITAFSTSSPLNSLLKDKDDITPNSVIFNNNSNSIHNNISNNNDYSSSEKHTVCFDSPRLSLNTCSNTSSSERLDNDYQSEQESIGSDRQYEPSSSIDNDLSQSTNIDKINNSSISVTESVTTLPKNNNTDLTSTNDISTASEEFSVSINKSTVGDAIRNSKKVIVPARSKKAKKYACNYCGKLVSKLVPHITTAHTDIDEVKRLTLIPKSSRRKGEPLTESQITRLELIKTIRNMGSYKHNLKASTNDVFITARRPMSTKNPKTVSNYALCPKCKGAYVKKSLHKHVAKCTMVSSKHNHSVQVMANKVLGNCHEEASELYRDVLSRLRNDDVGTIARFDLAIVLFGNLECFKYRHSKHHSKMIRAKVRRLGRLVLEMQSLSKEITDFSSILDPKHFDTYVAAVGALGKYEKDNNLYKNPHTPEAIGILTKEVCSQWVIECTKRKFEDKKKNAELFLFCFNSQFSKYVTSTVTESAAELKRLKKIKLPSEKDIAKLRIFLKDDRRNAFLYLINDEFNVNMWRKLLETTLVSVQLFNRRRAGEIERLKIINFEAIEQINEKTNPQEYNNLDQDAQEFVKKYSRILLRGKRNRTVPVLLDCELMKCIELIIEKRTKAKVSKSNPYVFGLPSADKKDFKFASACDLMRKFSSACGADVASSLRGTLLRKHIATRCISMNLSENEVEDLANFMGHADKIHREHYRISLAQRDILHVGKLLEQAQGIFYDSNPKKVVEETDSEAEETSECIKTKQIRTVYQLSKQDSSVAENDDNPVSGLKKKWTDEATSAVKEAFGKSMASGKFPCGAEIQNFLQTTPVSSLRGRTEPQVRSWLHKNKTLFTDSNTPNKMQRNTIPSSIYSVFSENIKNKEMPSVQELTKAYTQSPSLQKYSIQELQSMMSKAIEG